MTEKKTVKVTLVKSIIGCKKEHRDAIKGLGLGKTHSSRVLEDTPAVRGLIGKVDFLVTVE